MFATAGEVFGRVRLAVRRPVGRTVHRHRGHVGPFGIRESVFGCGRRRTGFERSPPGGVGPADFPVQLGEDIVGEPRQCAGVVEAALALPLVDHGRGGRARRTHAVAAQPLDHFRRGRVPELIAGVADLLLLRLVGGQRRIVYLGGGDRLGRGLRVSHRFFPPRVVAGCAVGFSRVWVIGEDLSDR